MIARLARHTFNQIVGNPDYRKAVALAIFIKDRKGASVWKDWSYRKVASLCQISPTTCKKRIAILIKLGMAHAFSYKGHNYLRFEPLRQGKITYKNKNGEGEYQPRTADVSLRQICHNSIKEIERGLMALFIVEDTRRKDYVKQLITLSQEPKPFTKENRVKRARTSCRERGYDKPFEDGGLSYRTIGRRLHCAHNTTKEIIAYGESLELFEAHRRRWILWQYVGAGHGKFALPYFQAETTRPLFATRSNIWYKPSLIFSLLSPSRQSI